MLFVCHPDRLASLLFRLLSSPSAPSPDSHRVAPPTKESEERAPCPALGGCHRHHIATDRPATRRAAPRAVCHPARLASLLFRLLSSPSAPSPAAHRVALPTKEREERAPCPALGGCHRHHLATTSPPIDQQPEGQRRGLSVILPASSSSPSPLPGGEGRVESQPGRATPSRSPCRPSPPCRGVR